MMKNITNQMMNTNHTTTPTRKERRFGLMKLGSSRKMVSATATATAPPSSPRQGRRDNYASDVDNDSERLLPEPQPDDHILWSCISRNDVILAEATAPMDHEMNSECESSSLKKEIAKTAQDLLRRKRTPGWEFHNSTSFSSRISQYAGQPKQQQSQSQSQQQQCRQRSLRGMKFHLYQHDDGSGGGGDSSSTNGDTNYNNTKNTPNNNSSSLIVWVFAAVYDANVLTKLQVQAFIEKIVILSEMLRDYNETWKYGGVLSCQDTFAPILLQRMQEVTYLGKLALMEDTLETTRTTMQENIELILQQEEQLRELQEEKASKLQDMACTFRKNAKAVRRAKMMQDAKHGIIIGTAIAVGTAIVVVPPLVALL